MTEVDFAYVDVFATAPLTGNPLTVVPAADGLSVPAMQALAREFNQSETTFLCAPTAPGATRRLRSFTPAGHEVFGAGHNALGAWLWLADTGEITPGSYAQEIGTDVLPVEVVGNPARVVMRQSPPTFGATADAAAVASALGLDAGQLYASPQVVDTGAGHLMVRVTDRAAVDAVTVDVDRLVAVLGAAGGEGCYVATTAGDDATAYARFFNPAMGIAEDPATGTAAGPLAALLLRDGEVSAGEPVIVEQGYATGRPSRLRVDVRGDRVELSGSGLVVGRGRMLVPGG